MSAPVRLAAFAAVLAVATLAGWAVGDAVGPDPGAAPAPAHHGGDAP